MAGQIPGSAHLVDPVHRVTGASQVPLDRVGPQRLIQRPALGRVQIDHALAMSSGGPPKEKAAFSLAFPWPRIGTPDARRYLTLMAMTIPASGRAVRAVVRRPDPALASRVLQVAPGNADLAAAGVATAVNVGITAGAFIASILLAGLGVRSTALVGGLLSLAALAVVLSEPLVAATGRLRAAPSPPARCC
jgi:hypothetical protein